MCIIVGDKLTFLRPTGSQSWSAKEYAGTYGSPPGTGSALHNIYTSICGLLSDGWEPYATTGTQYCFRRKMDT